MFSLEYLGIVIIGRCPITSESPESQCLLYICTLYIYTVHAQNYFILFRWFLVSFFSVFIYFILIRSFSGIMITHFNMYSLQNMQVHYTFVRDLVYVFLYFYILSWQYIFSCFVCMGFNTFSAINKSSL